MTLDRTGLDRRRFLSACTGAGVGSTLLPGVLFTLAAQAQGEKPGEWPKVTEAMLDQAAALAGVPLEPAQKERMLEALGGQREGYAEIRNLKMPNSVAPAFVFDPLPSHAMVPTEKREPRWSEPADLSVGSNLEELAYATVGELAALLQARKVTSVALTEMYLKRLKRYDAKLHFVITLTEERALAKAKQADEEIAAGRYRGPLHGIPWGAKDLLAVKGYPTTWGAGGFEHQSFDTDATVVQRLDAAGAVLVAKLTLGALAMGDKWFGGRTRNPWNTAQGSSGSSAGPASAVAAGCVGFAIGSETLGSISSPSTRCGDTGLRPTFGFVPRTGAMALSWTMDKLGPICRSVEDCAMVLSAIHGPDGEDLAVRDAAFAWDAGYDWKKLRVGYFKPAFDPLGTFKPHQAKAGESAEEKARRERRNAQRHANYVRDTYDQRYNVAALDKLRQMGVNLIPVELPNLPWGAMTPVLEAEAAAAFDELTMTGRDKLLTEQSPDDWPNIFRVARFLPAVEYIQAMRARTLGIRAMAKLFEQVDVIVTPSGGTQLTATNLTGHPALIVPNGLRGDDAPKPPSEDDGNDDNIGGPGTPVSITFLGGLYRDAELCAFGRAYQQATGFHRLHPKLQGVE
jgi:Asp-tRNA(Asn)/Glu-tRNA(Gln) amidotransferase A subunit family amidase